MSKKSLLAVGLSLLAAAAPALAASRVEERSFPVKARVPARATVESFVGGGFRETVTCRQACRVRTSVVIRARVARRLGFAHVRGRLVVIAASRATLKARTPTRLSLVPTREARKRLGAATSPVGIFGSVRAVPTGRAGASYSVGWASKLT